MDKLYTGQRLDDTGLYYYNARYYDPTIGRFISADSIVQSPDNPQSFNKYTYCFNNPVTYTDPLGLFSPEELNAAGIYKEDCTEDQWEFLLEAKSWDQVEITAKDGTIRRFRFEYTESFTGGSIPAPQLVEMIYSDDSILPTEKRVALKELVKSAGFEGIASLIQPQLTGDTVLTQFENEIINQRPAFHELFGMDDQGWSEFKGGFKGGVFIVVGAAGVAAGIWVEIATIRYYGITNPYTWYKSAPTARLTSLGWDIYCIGWKQFGYDLPGSPPGIRQIFYW